VSRFFDRFSRPEQLLASLPEAFRVLTDPAETGAVTISLPEDVQAEAYDWPIEFFEKRMPGMGTWWDVPVAEVSGEARTRQTREIYERQPKINDLSLREGSDCWCKLEWVVRR
jgi:TPP-dependent trihydroxycyclohexane-1,2-dione (THcHDO) dehydratase